MSVNQSDVQNVFQRIGGNCQNWKVRWSHFPTDVKQLDCFHLFFNLSCAWNTWSELPISILKHFDQRAELSADLSDDMDQKNQLMGDLLFDEIFQHFSLQKANLLRELIVQLTKVFNQRIKSFSSGF